MLVTKRGYKRTYAVGGSGIFDSVANFFKGMISSNAAKSMLDIGKAAALEAGKEAAIVAGKKLAEKGVNKLFSPPAATSVVPAPTPALTRPVLTPESQAIIDKYVGNKQNTNSLIDGSGRAVAIQDLVRRLNGSGLKSIKK